jgi:RNA polymerase sporulation-specific sigma factor
MFGWFVRLVSRLFFFTGYVGLNSSFPDPLPAEEERRCLEAMAQGDELAREKLIEHNLRLVAHIAKKYASPKRDSDDLISIGTVGLIKAVSTFNTSKSKTLAAYAARCIENAILSQRNKWRLRWRNGCLLRQNGACWRKWESAAIFCFPMYRVR